LEERSKNIEILQVMIEAQEKEREKIAHELNEKVMQDLSLCRLKLNDALEHNQISKKVLKNVGVIINQIIYEVRNIWHDLNNSTIHLIGLEEATNDLIFRVNKIGKIKIYLNANGSDLANKIEPNVTLAIFRIMQEQIANILKHAGATIVGIFLNITNTEIFVTICDNGKGFDTIMIKKEIGFLNIINRVELYNGTISLDTQPGKGCCLKVTIPTYGIKKAL
jgi:two-component system, NarL family, sensor histidine kinase UhpB